VVRASSLKRIADCTLNEIEQTLDYVMTLIGCRDEAIPDDKENVALIKNIRRAGSRWTLGEVRLAFEKLCDRELSEYKEERGHRVEQKLEVRPYQKFAYPYVKQVMDAYLDQVKRDAMLQYNQMVDRQARQKDVDVEAISKERMDTLVKDVMEAVKAWDGTGVLDLIYPEWLIYEEFKKRRLITLTDEERSDIDKEARQNLLTKADELSSTGFSSRYERDKVMSQVEKLRGLKRSVVYREKCRIAVMNWAREIWIYKESV
jgi:hypothetical protein